MSISFIRVDDRMIHGQTCTRWALEYPCDGLIARKRQGGYHPGAQGGGTKNASDKKTFVWTLDEWRAKCGKVLASKDRYFLITKDPITMKSILVDDGFDPGEVKTVIIGPCNDRPGATKLGNNRRSPSRKRTHSRPSCRRATRSSSRSLRKPPSATGRSSAVSSATKLGFTE